MAPLEGTKPEPEIYAEIIDRLKTVDPTIVAQLGSAAQTGPEVFALAFFSTVYSQPDLAGLALPALSLLGETFGAGNQALAMVWAMAHLAAIAQPGGSGRGRLRGRAGQQLRVGREPVRSHQDSPRRSGIHRRRVPRRLELRPTRRRAISSRHSGTAR